MNTELTQNTKLTRALWDIESHINTILASPHGSAVNARLQEALEAAKDLQVDEWNACRAMHLDYCLRCAANKGALSHEDRLRLVEPLWAAARTMRTESDPEPEGEGPGETQTPPKRRGAFRAIFRAIAKILKCGRNRTWVSNQYGDLHRAAEILAGYRLDPVEDEYERLVDWLHGNRMRANAHAASEREYQMWIFLERRGWSRADLKWLSDEATQGG